MKTLPIFILTSWVTYFGLAPHGFAQTQSPPAATSAPPAATSETPAARQPAVVPQPPSVSAPVSSEPVTNKPPTNKPAAVSIPANANEKCFDSVCSTALQKALNVIAKGLQLKRLMPADFIKFNGLDKLKSCASFPYTDAGDVYGAAASKGTLVYLVLLRGEISGSHALLGTDCGSLVALNPIQAMILSYLVEGAPKRDVALSRRAFLPTAPPGTKAEGEAQNEIRFRTEVGFVRIHIDSDKRVAEAQVSKDDGTLVFSEHYELAEK